MVRLMGVDRLKDFCFRRERLALNIKVYSYALSSEIKARVSRFPKDVAERLVQRAEEDTREYWWYWAEYELLKTWAPIYSEGRSGGWLVFSKLKRSDLEAIATDDEVCSRCDGAFEEHVDRKCLFDATEFEASFTYAETLFTTLEGVATQIRQSLDTIGQDVEAHLERLLEDVVDEQAVPGDGAGNGEPGDPHPDDPDGDAGPFLTA